MKPTLRQVVYAFALSGALTGCTNLFARSIARERVESFNRHDVAAYAETYTDDAILVAATGRRYVGRKAIEAYLRGMFEDAPDVSLELVDLDVTPIEGGYRNVGSFILRTRGKATELDVVTLTRKVGDAYLTYQATWAVAGKRP
jgi:hypothetical protein